MKLVKLYRPELCGVSPLGPLTELGEEINRLFEGSFGELSRPSGFPGIWAPAIELREDKDNLVAVVELPGMRKEDISISVHDGVLSVSGQRGGEQKEAEGTTHYTERVSGRFQRRVSLPKPVQVEAIKATYKDGLLTITLPKTEEAKPKQIVVME